MEAEATENKDGKEGKVDKLVAHVIECAETRFDIIALDVQDKVSDIMASMASVVIIGVLIGFIILLLSIGAAMYLSDYYHSPYIGFVYVAAFYIVLALLLLVTRKKVIKLPIINGILKKINFHEEDQHTFGT
jgi:uncharacterized membrane protein YqjE